MSAGRIARAVPSALLVLGLSGLAACGAAKSGDGDFGDVAPPDVVIGASAPSTTVVSTSQSTTGSPNPTTSLVRLPSVATDVSEVGDELEPFVGDASSEWCSVSAELIELSDAFEAAPLDDPVAIADTLTAFVDRMALIVFVAPPEIVDDVAATVSAFEQVRELLAAADFDMSRADLSPLDDQLTELGTSSARIGRYNREVCGLDPDAPFSASGQSGSGDGSTLPSNESTSTTIDAVRQQAIELLVRDGYSLAEAECIVDGLQAGDQTDAVLANCGVTLRDDGG